MRNPNREIPFSPELLNEFLAHSLAPSPEEQLEALETEAEETWHNAGCPGCERDFIDTYVTSHLEH